MRTRLTSLFLLLVLASGSLVGVPLHFGEQSCNMSDAMGDMDCCKSALMQSETPEVATARLCCALNCVQNGTTSPPNAVRVSPPSQQAVSTYPGMAQPLLNSLWPRHIDRAHGPPGSQPAYILNLALLI